MKLLAPGILYILAVQFMYCSSQLWSGDELSEDLDEDSDPKCECVAYFLCNEQGEIVSTGEGLVDWKDRSKPKCKKATDVCCFSAGVGGKKTSTTAAPELQPITTARPLEGQQLGCGRRSQAFTEKTSDRILNVGDENSDTDVGEFPWMLSVTRTQSDETGFEFVVFVCGASLIHPKVAVTSAHCIDKNEVKVLTVRAGQHDRSEENGYQTRGVSAIIPHHQFSSKSPRNDVALLVLESAFDLTDNVNTICVPSTDEIFVDRRCAATGWGASKLDSMPTSTTMKKVLLPVLERNRCKELFRTTRLGPRFVLHQSYICAGGEGGKDTCSKDGGGPLSCPSQYDKEKFILAGITSWGIGCGEKGIPGAYTDVAHFRNWIDDQLDSFGINI